MDGFSFDLATIPSARNMALDEGRADFRACRPGSGPLQRKKMIAEPPRDMPWRIQGGQLPAGRANGTTSSAIRCFLLEGG